MVNAMLLYAHLTDKELIERVKTGNLNCYEVLIRKHTQALYRIGRMYDLNSARIEELILDTHLTAFKSLDKYNAHCTYRSWLMRIMIAKCLEELSIVDTIANLDDCVEPASKATRCEYHYNIGRKSLEQKQLENKLENSVEKLPVKLRCVFVLKEIEGYSEKETATLLNIPEAKVRMRMTEAKKLLKRTISNWHYHADVYNLEKSYCDRIVNIVLCKLDRKEYHVEEVLAPRY
jgi:RNA polymerase sigma-70 factor (ECF subfamily)